MTLKSVQHDEHDLDLYGFGNVDSNLSKYKTRFRNNGWAEPGVPSYKSVTRSR